ncbi:PTS sugar transporter subunit IIA, partial [bacterium]|nr:PTS sugar transporter subunit IIA [bacterium]
MRLSALLTPARVLLDIHPKDKDALITQMVEALSSLGVVSDLVVLEKEIKEREALGNTGIGRGVGFPHAKSSQVTDIQ